MQITVMENTGVAVVEDADGLIRSAQDALDLIATVWHVYQCQKMILPKSALADEFFDLKTGLAGEILQKYTNYRMKLAIVGDFSVYTSKALRDFIYESNKGNQVLFLQTRAEALERLESLQ